MPRWRRRRWPSSGQSWSWSTTSWAESSHWSPIMPRYSGWPERRTLTLVWPDGSWRSRTSTLTYDIGQGLPTPTRTDSPACGQLSQVCQGFSLLQPPPPPSLGGPGRRLGGGVWHVSRAPISVALATEKIHLHAITADWSVPAEAAQERATKASTTQSLVSNDSRRQPTNVCPYFLPESSWPISPPHEHRTPNPLHAKRPANRITTHGRSITDTLAPSLHLLFNKYTLRGPVFTATCRVILQPATLVENAGILLEDHRQPTITVTS